MRRNWHHTYYLCARYDDWATYRQSITGTAGRGVHYESIGLICSQELAIYLHINANHRRDVMLQYRNFIQSVRITLYSSSVFLHHQHRAFLYTISIVINMLYGRFYVFCLIVRQESQSTHIYAKDGHSFIPYASGSLQKCAIASH